MNNLINEIQNLNETQLTQVSNFLQTLKTDKSLLQQNLEILKSPPKNLPPEFYKTEFFQQHKLFKTIFFLTKLNYHSVTCSGFDFKLGWSWYIGWNWIECCVVE